MPWARLDERFPGHRRIRKLSDAAFRLHVSGVCWSCEYSTDGHIGEQDLDDVSDIRRPDKAAEELVRAGRWHLPGHRCPSIYCWPHQDGWLIHNFLEYNPSRAEVEEKREKDAERKRRGRERSPSGVRVESERTPDGVTVESARTEPTRTEPTTTTDVVVGRGKRGTRFPEQWFLNGELRSWAADKCPAVDVNAETEQWADYHRAKGDTAKDWPASWRTWMRNAQKWSRTQQERPSNMDGHLALVRRLEAGEVQQGEIA